YLRQYPDSLRIVVFSAPSSLNVSVGGPCGRLRDSTINSSLVCVITSGYPTSRDVHRHVPEKSGRACAATTAMKPAAANTTKNRIVVTVYLRQEDRRFAQSTRRDPRYPIHRGRYAEHLMHPDEL